MQPQLYTYFDNQHDHNIMILDACFSQNTAYNKKCDPHLALLYASDFY